MMKKISVILAVLLILPSLFVGARADEVWTFRFVIDGRDVTVTSGERISGMTAYLAAYQFTNYYIYGMEPPTMGAEYYSTDASPRHTYTTVTVTSVTHKYFASAPRCIEYVYRLKICEDCGHTYKTLVDQNRIYCCAEDSIAFDDVPKNAWYYNAVGSCSAAGYMSGSSAKRFSPDDSLTRAMFAVILAKIDGADLSGFTGGTGFRDVPSGEWYSAAIKWASAKGYTSGMGNGTFGLKNKVTREQLAVFLYNYTVKKGYGLSQKAYLFRFSDRDSVSSWAEDGMRWAVGAGLISGTSSSALSPKKSATRAEAAAIIMNYVNNIKNR